MLIDVLTIFPEFFGPFLSRGMVGQARKKQSLEVRCTQLRAFTEDRYRSVDDRPYGGGPGMLIKPEPVFRALDLVLGAIEPRAEASGVRAPRLLLTCPRGERLRQPALEELATQSHLVILCGRYEGLDHRIESAFPWQRVSLGDYVLSGGEVPAMAVIEGVARLLPGVLGDAESAVQDSFSAWAGDGGHDHPHFTRPPKYRGYEVPPVLLSGNHAEIAAWRRRCRDQQGPFEDKVPVDSVDQ
ncbi:MAG: tRNA (guanosine(37)-N1)-methyltransferase TrmD [Planctomycetota bacterium]